MDAGGGRSGRRERLKNKHAGGRVGGNAERVGLRSPWRRWRWKRRMGGRILDRFIRRPTDRRFPLSLTVGVENGAVFRSHFIAIIAIAINAPAFLALSPSLRNKADENGKGHFAHHCNPVFSCTAPKEISNFVMYEVQTRNMIKFFYCN